MTKAESLITVIHISHNGGPSPPEGQRKYKADKRKLYFHVCENILPDCLSAVTISVLVSLKNTREQK